MRSGMVRVAATLMDYPLARNRICPALLRRTPKFTPVFLKPHLP